MKLKRITIGCVCSVLIAVPGIVLAVGGSQTGSQMGGAGKGVTKMERTTSRIHSQAAIRAVQEKLNAEGYNVGKADGIWGPRSAAALRKYQQDKGLKATGRLDQETAKGLELEEGEFAAFENALGQRSRSRMEQKQQSGKPNGMPGGM